MPDQRPFEAHIPDEIKFDHTRFAEAEALDIQDNYRHGSDGPMPVRRRQSGPCLRSNMRGFFSCSRTAR
jgi:hypothetical protein